MDDSIQMIISEEAATLREALELFSAKFQKEFSFSFLNNKDLRVSLWTALGNLLKNPQTEQIYVLLLSAIRILSRDKECLNELATQELIDKIGQLSYLTTAERYTSNTEKHPVIVEALKCLSNLVFQSLVAATNCSKNGAIKGIIERATLPNVLYDVKFFDVRLLFLLSGICKETRPIICYELNGFEILVNDLNLQVENAKKRSEKLQLKTAEVKYICEILKVLFNISLAIDEKNDEECATCNKLVTLLRNVFSANFENSQDAVELYKQAMYLLTSVKENSLQYLIYKLQSPVDASIPKNCIYEEYDVRVVHTLLQMLKKNLETKEEESTDLISALTALLKMSSNDRIMRKYLRKEILPPLRDVHHRPEDGKTLRNRLCKLLTSANMSLKNLSAEFLFVLCKQNVERMIKYTGYGNAAGLFSTHGLLGGKNKKENFISESEDSDTEEYLSHLHGINPVVGCYESPKSNPCENMTEEQKEYEAMKMVEVMDKLARSGIIQPCTIGEDGKAKPIEHVLQLQEGLKDQQIDKKN